MADDKSEQTLVDDEETEVVDEELEDEDFDPEIPVAIGPDVDETDLVDGADGDDDDEDEKPAKGRKAKAEEEDDEDEPDDDDVEADLDTILKDRIASGDDDDEDEEEEEAAAPVKQAGSAVPKKKAGEFTCTGCFYVVSRSQFGSKDDLECPFDEDPCPSIELILQGKL